MLGMRPTDPAQCDFDKFANYSARGTRLTFQMGVKMEVLMGQIHHWKHNNHHLRVPTEWNGFNWHQTVNFEIQTRLFGFLPSHTTRGRGLLSTSHHLPNSVTEELNNPKIAVKLEDGIEF